MRERKSNTFTGPLIVGERYVEKLKTVREKDVEGLGMRVETCHVCIEREKSCAVVRLLPWLEKKKKSFLMT